MKLFKNLNYKQYLEKNPIHKLFNIDLKKYGPINKKIERSPFETVNNKEYKNSVELDDLLRLHYLITKRKVTTILEIGVGKSTVVFSDALRRNEELYGEYVRSNLRRSNPFECHSVDTNKKWIDKVKKENSKLDNIEYHFAKCEIGAINHRICTFFNKLPNICPDLIYLDGPDQYSPKGNIRGISTQHPDRMPMSADLIAIEHFLVPGTLIVVDGRTANARFLKANFQRNWDYYHDPKFDQHFFELKESPLGSLNKKQIEFCLGKDWLKNKN